MAEERVSNPLYAAITKSSDLVMAICIITVLVVMIIPLPTWTLDIFLTVSIW